MIRGTVYRYDRASGKVVVKKEGPGDRARSTIVGVFHPLPAIPKLKTKKGKSK